MSRFPLGPEQQQALAKAFGANPAFQQLGWGNNSSAINVCSAERVMLAGGQLMSYVTPESLVPFEAVYRRLPEDGIFTATPSTPCQFENGSFRVPQSQGLVLLDYHFNIYRPSGIAAGDYVPLEDNRLSTQVGWTLKKDSMLQGNTHYELNPLRALSSSAQAQQGPQQGQVYGGNTQGATEAQFEAARAGQAQGAIGGLSVMPQRHHRQGIMHVPAPWLFHSNQTLQITCHVFRAIQIPLAFFEAEIFGFLIPDNDLLAISKALAPCANVGGGT